MNPRKKTLDKYKFFARKQKQGGALRQFWHVLTGLAAKCEFGDQTNSLIMDAFIQNMNNKTGQQRLCTEPRDTQHEALRFTVAFEEGISPQRSFGGEVEKIKDGPIYSINQRPKNPCTRCGLEFVQNHLSTCKAKDEQCRNCGGIGHFARKCKKAKTVSFRGSATKTISGRLRRVNLFDQQNIRSEGSTDEEADNLILQVNGDGALPFVLKETINLKNRTMIDSGSHITIFTQGDLGKILK